MPFFPGIMKLSLNHIHLYQLLTVCLPVCCSNLYTNIFYFKNVFSKSRYLGFLLTDGSPFRPSITPSQAHNPCLCSTGTLHRTLQLSYT